PFAFMEIIHRRQRMSSIARKLRREQDKTIGLVPTMGALHEGHLSLVREARQICDIVIVSIFVNPAQFGKGEDFDKYPRDLTGDAALLTDYNVNYIFAPQPEEIYSPGFSTFVYVEGLSDVLEGAARPGHFRGVSTVVAILLNTVRPDFIFFGQKDGQQVAIIKRMIRDLAFDTEAVVMPTVREESGLAMSSRNAYLSNDERNAASIIYRALREAKVAYKNGERNAAHLSEIVADTINREPLARLEYIAVADAETLQPLDRLDEETVLLAVAVRFGKARLIDNAVLNKK
ncbi:MAG TPA: pantoate--beta-alanine ligase, partial [Pyrinomonadaceae bacterium]|nr:pantoate--beta-alanine ligase [Pyrinomonadaceae bacterium]